MAIEKQNNNFLNFRQLILDFPRQFRIGVNSAKEIKFGKKFGNLVICGMGGSALPGDLLKIWLNLGKIDFPVYIHRDYNLPNQAKSDSLIICISYSGNTEETISAFTEAKKKNLNLVTICSGGKLEKLSRNIQAPVAKVPSGIPPRMAMGFQFGALMEILASARLTQNSIKDLLILEKKLQPEALEEKGKNLAKKLVKKIPLIYSSTILSPLARIWKIKFNENAKIPAFYNFFPEFNHNEMVGFTKGNDNFFVIILEDRDDHPRVKKRMKLSANIFKKRGMKTEIINLEGKNWLYKIFNNILLSDWTSYYLALSSKIDPWSVNIVEEFKLAMKKKI